MAEPANPAFSRRLMDAPVRVDIVLGEVRMPISTLSELTPGDILSLDKTASEPIDVYVSDRLMARGRLVVADGQLGVTICEILDTPEAA